MAIAMATMLPTWTNHTGVVVLTVSGSYIHPIDMVFPETGTREEFKDAVLHNMLRSTCEDCKQLFIPVIIPFMQEYFERRCPRCESQYVLAAYMPLVVNMPSIAMMGVMT